MINRRGVIGIGLGGAALCLTGAFRPARASGTMLLVAENDWAPYTADVNGNAAGISVDIIRAACEAAGQSVAFEVAPYNRGMKETASGLKVGVFNTAHATSLEADYFFHPTPLFEGVIAIWGRGDDTRTGVTEADLEGKVVGVTIGYTYVESFDTNPRIKREEAPSDESQLRKLAAGRADHAIVYDKVAALLIGRNKEALAGRVRQVGILGKAPLHVSFSRKHPDGARFAEVLEKGMQKIVADGTRDRILADWDARLLAGKI